MSDRGFTAPLEGERPKRNTQLNGRYEQRRFVEKTEGRRRTRAAVVGLFLDPRPADRHECKFRRYEKRVERDDRENYQKFYQYPGESDRGVSFGSLKKK